MAPKTPAHIHLLTGDDPSLLADALHELIHELLAGEDRDFALGSITTRAHAHNDDGLAILEQTDEREHALLCKQALPGEFGQLPFEANARRHADDKRRTRLLIGQGMLFDQPFWVDLQTMVLCDGREALHNRM